jgi:hypothetical protein
MRLQPVITFKCFEHLQLRGRSEFKGSLKLKHSSTAAFLSKGCEILQNFDSPIFPYQTLDSDTISISARGPWSASMFLWIVIQCRSAIRKFVAPDISLRLQTFWP